MTAVVPISKRGTVTLPPSFRIKFGLGTEHPLVLIEERDGEIILRPAVAVAVRDIPKQVIENWVAEDEAGMRDFLALKK